VLVVDASCLYEVITEGPPAPWVRQTLLSADDPVAPEIIDSEVVGVLRRDVARGELEVSRAEIAIVELFDWPGERIALRNLNQRVWDLRANVRTNDAYYVALAEAIGCPLITLDARLTRASGPRCTFLTP
jgi:Predicted nucleic acid-binding protein, contains PIN domain